VAVIYLSLLVLIPLAAVVYTSTQNGAAGFWDAVTAPDALSALVLTLAAAALVTAVNTVMGTVLAWVLVRDSFPGRSLVDALVDLPLVLPTIVAGLVLVELYGPSSPVHVNLAYTQAGVALLCCSRRCRSWCGPCSRCWPSSTGTPSRPPPPSGRPPRWSCAGSCSRR